MRINALLLSAALLTTVAVVTIHAAPELEKRQSKIENSVVSALRPDPAVTWGTLPNGLRYAVMPNAEPPDRITLRLCVDTGSLMETESQRGVSHFLEHMAFNGTAHFPADQLIERFQRKGFGFGSDVNAHTGMHETVYKLDLPKIDPETVADCLQLLRDYADGQLLATEEIDKERGVILSELRSRDSVAWRTQIAAMEFLFPSSLLSSRMPIGIAPVIEKAPREEFVSIYRAGHIPSRMTLVATGAVDAKTFIPLIEKYFANMKDPVNPITEPNLSWKQVPGPHASLHYEAEAPAVTITFATTLPAAPKVDSPATRRADLYRTMAHMIFSRRLEIQAKATGCPFVAKGTGVEELFRAAILGTLDVECQPAHWEATLKSVEQELRRAVKYGFTQAEIAEVKATILAAAERAAAAAPTRKSNHLADEIYQSVLDREIFTCPKDELELTRASLASLKPEMVLTEFRKIWDTADLGIFVAGNLKLDDPPARILAALAASRTVAVTPPVEEKMVKFAYTDFGPAGTVAKRRDIADLGVIQLTLSNNIRVNIKPTDFEKDTVHVSIRFDGGTLCTPPSKPGLFMLANNVFTGGGLGKHSADELGRILAGRNVSAGFNAGSDAFELGGATTPADFLLELQYLAAFVTDPGYRPESLRVARKNFDALYPTLRTTMMGVFRDQVARYLASSDPRFGYPKETELAARTLDEVRDWLAHPLATGYMEITIIGDVKADDAIAGVLKTFGALPAREKKMPAYKKERRVNFPKSNGKPAEFPFATKIPQAMCVVFWPTGVDRVEDSRAYRRLAALAEIVDDRLRVEIREKLGETYSPFARCNASDTYPDYGFIMGAAIVAPDQTSKLSELIRQLGADLAAKGATQDELDRSLKPVLTAIDKELRSNGFWLGSLAGSQQRPKKLDRIRDLKADTASITIGEINKLARKYFRTETAQPVLVFPAKTP